MTFSWAGVADDAVVRLRIYDEAERPLYGMEARGLSKQAPQELRALLEPATPYQWQVARVDADGEDTDHSPMTPFSVR